MNTGTKIALGAGVFFLLSRQQAAARTAAAQASSPVAAASAGITSLEKSLFALLNSAISKGSSPAKAGSSGGLSPAGGAGSGRSAGGATPTSSVEDVFGTFDNLNTASVIPVTAPDGTVPPPDFNLIPSDPAADNSLIDSLVTTSSDVPQFAGTIDPATGLAISDAPLGVDPTTGDITNDTSGGF